jgi:hypothetical protein
MILWQLSLRLGAYEMRIRTNTTCITALILLFMATFTSGIYGSGYHPGFDQAIKEAKIIVAGKVTESWSPKSKSKSRKYTWSAAQRTAFYIATDHCATH